MRLKMFKALIDFFKGTKEEASSVTTTASTVTPVVETATAWPFPTEPKPAPKAKPAKAPKAPKAAKAKPTVANPKRKKK